MKKLFFTTVMFIGSAGFAGQSKGLASCPVGFLVPEYKIAESAEVCGVNEIQLNNNELCGKKYKACAHPNNGIDDSKVIDVRIYEGWTTEVGSGYDQIWGCKQIEIAAKIQPSEKKTKELESREKEEKILGFPRRQYYCKIEIAKYDYKVAEEPNCGDDGFKSCTANQAKSCAHSSFGVARLVYSLPNETKSIGWYSAAKPGTEGFSKIVEAIEAKPMCLSCMNLPSQREIAQCLGKIHDSVELLSIVKRNKQIKDQLNATIQRVRYQGADGFNGNDFSKMDTLFEMLNLGVVQPKGLQGNE